MSRSVGTQVLEILNTYQAMSTVQDILNELPLVTTIMSDNGNPLEFELSTGERFLFEPCLNTWFWTNEPLTDDIEYMI